MMESYGNNLSVRYTVCACVIGVMAGVLFIPAAFGQGRGAPPKTFAAPEDAANSLAIAYQKGDSKAAAEILGDKAERLVFSGDPVMDQNERDWFVSLYQEGHEIVADTDRRVILQIGKDGQPYPIPLVKKDTQWRFDATEGHEDLLSRRISKAELTALNLVSAYVDAQREYHQKDHNGDGIREYAQRFRSTAGRKDGLYWEGASDKREGPMAPLVDAASKEGYGPNQEGAWPVYRGYFYKILSAQGSRANGGAQDYIVNGRMTEGFALVAFPVRYGVSGVLTFLVNQEGAIYQKDLGPKTAEVGRQMTRFDPDPSWSKGQAK